ncbi:MAG: hypothetical protein Q9160_007587 [Pyrenula sp. 1 TL-2023]
MYLSYLTTSTALFLLTFNTLLCTSIPTERQLESSALLYNANFARTIDNLGRSDIANLLLARSMRETSPSLTLRAAGSKSCPKCTKMKCPNPKEFREQVTCKCIGCSGPANPKPDMTGCDCPQGQKMSADGKNCENDCGPGRKPTADGKGCEKDCGPGKKPGTSGTTCETVKDCPAGNKFDAVMQRCVLDCGPGKGPGQDGKCPKDCGPEKKPGPNGKDCIPDCGPGRKPNPTKTGCEDAENKKKEGKAKEAKGREAKRFKDQRKTRMGKCLTIVPLMMGVGGAIGLPGGDPYSWCNNWFDENFINDDQLMTYWSRDLTDIDWNVNMDDQSENGFLSLWTKRIQNEEERDSEHCTCGICSRDLDELREVEKRCPAKKRDEEQARWKREQAELAKTRDLALRHANANAALMTRQAQAVPIIGNIVEVVLEFLGVFSRFASTIARGASRLMQLVKKGEKFLSVARKGEKINSKGPDDMKDAASKISKNDNLWKACLRGKGPAG